MTGSEVRKFLAECVHGWVVHVNHVDEYQLCKFCNKKEQLFEEDL